MKGFDFGDS